MSNRYSTILSPLPVGKHLYKNRIIGAPMYCGPFVTRPYLSDVIAQSVEDRARGGCAQVTIGSTPVDYLHGNHLPDEPVDYSIHSGPLFSSLSNAAAVIHENNALAMIELSHCGRSKVYMQGALNPIGPSGYIRDDGVEVQEMDEQLMMSVCGNFISAAEFMEAAGFDGVVIQAGHGWLLHQFLSPRMNYRSDEYGGSLENRSRFPLRVLRTLREAMGPDFLIELRISGQENVSKGMEIDESAAFCSIAQEFVDVIHVSAGVYQDPVNSGQFSSMFHPHGLNAEYAAAVKKAVSVPVTVVGGITSADQAAELIDRGVCDCVALGRQLTADPSFVKKIAAGRADDITPCVRCFKCFPGPLNGDMPVPGTAFGCSVNPEAFFFDWNVLTRRSLTSRSVLVAGGGPGGMSAALTAAKRGHRVILVEREGVLGGELVLYAGGMFSDYDLFRDVLVQRIERNGNIVLRLNTTLNKELLDEVNPDAVVIAIGAEVEDRTFPGEDRVFPIRHAYDPDTAAGKEVVILGGSREGCEAGLYLANGGSDVTVIEPGNAIAWNTNPMHRAALISRMKQSLTWKTGWKCISVSSSGVECRNGTVASHFLNAQTVFLAEGRRIARTIPEEILSAAGDAAFFRVGDTGSTGTVYDSVREGYLAGMSIL